MADQEKIALTVTIQAIGSNGFFHFVPASYVVNKAQFEMVQRAVVQALLGLQSTAPK